jgi:hypothetical protein
MFNMIQVSLDLYKEDIFKRIDTNGPIRFSL